MAYLFLLLLAWALYAAWFAYKSREACANMLDVLAGFFFGFYYGAGKLGGWFEHMMRRGAGIAHRMKQKNRKS